MYDFLIRILLNKIHSKTIKENLEKQSIEKIISSLCDYYDNSRVFYYEGKATTKNLPSNYVYNNLKKIFDDNLDNTKNFIDNLKPYFNCDNLKKVTNEKQNEVDPYWNNGYYTGIDSKLLYSIVCYYKPKKIIEIGSGNSTRFINKAISDEKLNTDFRAIDVGARIEVNELKNVKFIKQNFLDFDVNEFKKLEKGDIAFLDGSHLCMNGSSAVKFFLEVLPILNKGVIIHIHDITLPFEYEESCQNLGYGEQYLLATLLLNSKDYTILCPSFYLRTVDEFKNVFKDGNSFWMIKL